MSIEDSDWILELEFVALRELGVFKNIKSLGGSFIFYHFLKLFLQAPIPKDKETQFKWQSLHKAL